MDGVPNDDPFSWDAETVTQELCSPDRPWAQDSSALAKNISEEEIDGYTLLTYEFLYSRKELMECLGIRTARRKAALAEAVIDFQASSRAFRSWKKDFVRKQSMDLSDNEPDFVNHYITPTHRVEKHENPTARLVAGTLPSLNPPWSRETADQGIPSQYEGNSILPDTSDLTRQLLDWAGNGTPQPETHPGPDLAESPRHQAADILTSTPNDEKWAPKRRRVAPTNLSTKTLTDLDPLTTTKSGSFNLLNGANTASRRMPSIPEKIFTLHSYLGREKVDILAVVSHTDSLASRALKHDGDTFTTLISNRVPCGQRLVINRIMKKLLVRNARKEALMKQGIALMRSPSPSEEDDEVLDLDDLPDLWDDDTLKEMAEEEAEIATRERQQARCLTQDRVETILQECIKEMKSKWEETKLPKYQRKAYKLWTDARRRERIKKYVIEAQQQAEFYESRIKKLYAEILKDTWQKEQDVRSQARVMEQNLEDKLYRLWLINLLGSRVQPQKPTGIPLPKAPAKAPSTLMDDEVLTSSDEDDFIVPSDEGEDDAVNEEAAQGNEFSPEPRYESPFPVDMDPSMCIDLTQLESPEKCPGSEATRTLIDLTTPTKPKSEALTPAVLQEADGNLLTDAPSMEQLESVETIGEFPVSHWAKQKDRWRLVICIIWKLTQVRRQWILRVVQKNSAEDAWRASILLQLSRPLTQESQIGKVEVQTSAFDLTRIFLSFIRCRQCKDARIMALHKKDKNRLRDGELGLFPLFCAFIRELSPSFPQDCQIFRTDALDGETDMSEDNEGTSEVVSTPSKVRKYVTKEIVQNKEGVDLREREQKRVEEQETRRLRLRAALATSNSMASDRSRLIINETKQEDQSFIYVNEDIGNQIKDYQIEGVRFLWNQIVLDAAVRQGCLLAHTMGLGKTMQVITFLVAIIEATKSDDASVQAQIPKDLRRSQTLVLCPSGLVDNWMDEVLLWAPKGLLGNVRKVEALMPPEDRLESIKDWKRDGGILIMGYEMFKRTCEVNEDIEAVLINTPNIVVADEAHVLKNPSTKVHQVCGKFRTGSRIALTGSPLSNNVEEYFAMIDWVAPNYLGPLQEFRDIYAKPILQGLWVDSSKYEKTRALKRLEVLKMTVAPKVHRATIHCIKNDLPPKHEFVISVVPTPMQKRLYELYLTGITLSNLPQAKIFSIMNDLALVCNHPRCFRHKAQDMRQKVLDGTKSAFSEGIISAVLKETNGHDLDNPTLSRKVEFLILILDEARKMKDKVLVFSQSIPTLNYLENLLLMQKRRVCRLDGDTAINKRQEMIKSFNSGNQEVYLISTNAGGVGLNIQGANRVVIFDFKWNPTSDQQAVGRAYRFGQKKAVFVYRFLVAGSFEEVLQNRAVFKMQLASRVVDKKNPVSWGKRLGILFHPLEPTPAHDLSPFLNRDSVLNKLICHEDNNEAIRQIVSTDTFEEEDIANQLSAEDAREVREWADMERLRHADREGYDKLMQARQVEQAHLHQLLDANNPPKGRLPLMATYQAEFSHVSQSVDGAFDGPSSELQGQGGISIPLPQTQTQAQAQAQPQTQTQTHAPHEARPQLAHIQPAAVPLPMAGANTYFGKDAEPAPGADKGALATPQITQSGLEPTPTPKKNGLFSQPRSQTKDEFESKLASILGCYENKGLPGFAGSAKGLAHALTAAIDKCRKEQSLGFLFDNQRWRLLLDSIQAHDRFVPATVSGFWSPNFLAAAKVEEIERRIYILNGLSNEEFRAQLQRSTSAPDPDNLHNISRSSMQSPKAKEDMEVMRQAADKRRQRAFPLAPWANKVLSENRGEAS